MRNGDYRFDIQLAEGLAAEAWFYEMSHGGDRFEVKHDKVALSTRRVYVEYEDDPGRRGIYRPSGIATTESDCWIFVFGEPPLAFLGIDVDRLKELARAALGKGLRAEQPHGSCPTHGALIPLNWLLPDGD